MREGAKWNSSKPSPLLEENLTDAASEAQRRTVEELRVLMYRNLSFNLRLTYRPRPGKGMD
jgi:hypothetical protein